MRRPLCASLFLFAAAKEPEAERAAEPSPRTTWSVKARDAAQWKAYSELLRQEAGGYRATGGTQLVLLGDSITEAWRGTSYGLQVPRAKGVPDVLRATLAARWPVALNLAISADMTQHVLWRLQQGELTEELRRDPHACFVLLIGTNNLGNGAQAAAETHRGVVAVAEHLLNRTAGRLLLNALLPRGDGQRSLKRHCPPGASRVRSWAPVCTLNGKSMLRSFLPAIQHVNALLGVSIVELAQRYGSRRVGFADCGSVFLAAGASRSGGIKRSQGEEVETALMPDKLHPNDKGHAAWARCLQNKIERLLEG